MYEELPHPLIAKPSSKIFEGDIDDNAQFPLLSTAALHGPDETPSVAAETSQSAEQQKRSSTASSNFQDVKSPSKSTEEEERGGGGGGGGEVEGEEGNEDGSIDSGSESHYESPVRRFGPAPRQHEISRAYRQSLRMYELAISRRDDADGNREELYRRQHDRRVQAGKEPETREAFDARWNKDHDRFVRNTEERLRRDVAMAQEAEVWLPWSHKLTLATPEIVLTTPERLRRPPSDPEEDLEENLEDTADK
jgi:hypothetical protein